MGSKRTSTIGYEKQVQRRAADRHKEKFIASLTTNMPAAPDHFSRCSATNAEGPGDGQRSATAPADRLRRKVASRAKEPGTVVLDCRSYDAFGGQHVPGSIHVDFGGNFVTFSGWVVPVDRTSFWCAKGLNKQSEATAWLRRVGLDRTVGYLDGGLYNWARQGLPTATWPSFRPTNYRR
jgi:hydroxyacylglutathione hydrolase